MRYAAAADFRQALEQRLINVARHEGIRIDRMRKTIAFERLLARLVHVASDRWVLKGALALEFRFGSLSRMTRDMDLGRSDSEEMASSDFLTAQAIDLGDHFQFFVEKTRKLDLVTEESAIRYHVVVSLAGRRFEDVTLDIGFTDTLVTQPDRIIGPAILGFAEIAAIEVPVLPLDQHVAEKLHAYCRVYSGGRRNTRVKDLVDLVLVSSLADFDAERLQSALVHTFGQRESNRLPANVPPPPQQWAASFPELAGSVGITTDVFEAHRLVATFLDPILTGAFPQGACWDSLQRSWQHDYTSQN